jgi:tRNA G18 (ribose-2'-O)-methylase SpoU
MQQLVSPMTSLYTSNKYRPKGISMLMIKTIASLEEGDLKPYRTLRQPLEHERQGFFVAESERVVARLMESDLSIVSVLITPEWLEVYRNRLEDKSESIAAFVAEKNLLHSIVGFHLHQGIMAVARIPVPLPMEAILHRSPRPFLLAAIDGITNSENLGVLVRNCAAFGVQALLVGETSSSPYLRRAVRNSMGAIFKLPVVQPPDITRALTDLHSHYAINVIAAHPPAHQERIDTVDFRRDCCVVFGSEGNGISAAVLSACNAAAAVPMELGVDSLNVASASAVFLYEVMKQRRAGPTINER